MNEAAPSPPPPARLLRLAGGFLCLFWGVALALLGFFGAMRIAFLEIWQAPGYLVGVAVLLWGLHLLRGGPGTPIDLSRGVRRAAWPGGLALYLGPFVYWWRYVPQSDYFIVHIFALLLVALWLLYEVNRLAAAASEQLGALAFAVEARLCGWVVALLTAPAAAFFVYGLWGARRHGTGLYAEFFRLLFQLPRGVLVAGLIPFTLTMAAAWRARHFCLQALRAEPADGAVPAGSGER